MRIERVVTIPINMLIQALIVKAGKLTKSNKGAMIQKRSYAERKDKNIMFIR